MTDEQPAATEAPEDPGPSDSTPAVRTVSEDERFHVIEGRAIPYGGPFNGRDSYGTYFSVRTDLGLDHELPIKLWYNHGFDEDFGTSTIGHTTSVRTADDGIWVQAQLDKRHKYYETRVKPLLEKGGLGMSAGSAEHSYREDRKTGELLSYPVHEISLTPVEANPWAYIAARSDEITATIVRITDGVRATEGEPEPVVDAPAPEPDPIVAIRADVAHILQLLTAERSATEATDDQPVTITVREDVPDFEAVRAGLLAKAEENGKAVAVRATR